MRLKDIFELETYGFNPEDTVEIFDMEGFERAVGDNAFSEVYLPKDADAHIYRYAFLIEDSILIAMAE